MGGEGCLRKRRWKRKVKIGEERKKQVRGYVVVKTEKERKDK